MVAPLPKYMYTPFYSTAGKLTAKNTLYVSKLKSFSWISNPNPNGNLARGVGFKYQHSGRSLSPLPFHMKPCSLWWEHCLVRRGHANVVLGQLPAPPWKTDKLKECFSCRDEVLPFVFIHTDTEVHVASLKGLRMLITWGSPCCKVTATHLVTASK